MRRRFDETVRWTRSAAIVLSLLTVALDSGCNSKDEEPPSRPRALGRPGWESPEVSKGGAGTGTGAPVNGAGTGVAADDAAVEAQGAVAKVLERYRTTERAIERGRAVDAVLPDMTIKDLNDALHAINTGKRLEAEVGMALVTGYYTRQKEWTKIEDGFKQFFQAVPELRFDPSYILEHAWTLMKMGQFKKSIERTNEAERFFQNLAAGQPTLEHQARLAECRAWANEGLFRESVAKGADDEESALYRQRAVQAWEAFKAILVPVAAKDKSYQDRIAQADDHISGFKSSER